MKTLGFLLITFGVVSSDSVFAQYEQLLTPITGPELTAVKSNNDYFLKKSLYTASWHQIVSADVELLLSGEPFVITLIGNDSITVEPIEINTMGDGAGIVWIGQVQNPARSVSDMLSETGNEKEAQIAHEAAYGVTITGSRAELDTATGINIPIFTQNEQKAMRPEFRGSGDSSKWFYQIGATLKSRKSGKVYSLSSLEMGGPYHLLKEIDPEKVMRPGFVDASREPERAKKRKDWRDFLDSLGEDPREELRRSNPVESQQ